MAEYIDREKINLFGFYDAGDYSQAMRCIKSLPTADVIEREKIDKAIEEIEQYGAEEQECGDQKIANTILDVLKILKRNIGE